MILISSLFFFLSVLWHRICNAFWLPFSLQQKLDWRTLIFFFCMVRKKKSVLHIVLDDSGNANLRNYHAKWQSQLQKDLGHVWLSLQGWSFKIPHLQYYRWGILNDRPCTQCGNYGNLLSLVFDKTFMKATLLLIESWFHEIILVSINLGCARHSDFTWNYHTEVAGKSGNFFIGFDEFFSIFQATPKYHLFYRLCTGPQQLSPLSRPL